MNEYSLIAKYLAGQCTEIELSDLEKWRNVSMENEKLFEELENEWKLLNTEMSENIVFPDKELVWNNIKQKVNLSVKSYSRTFLIRIASMAAMFALVIGLSFSYVFDSTVKVPTLSSTFIAPEGHKSQLLLADGTKVWLNSGSSITYTNKFGDGDRTVELNGEAFFDVTKNPNLKFIVKTNSVNVVVHGTAFNVKSYASDSEVSVSLLHGKVDVLSSSNNNSIALLAPGDRLVVEKSDLNCKIEKCDASLDAIWRLDKLKFEGATIAEVAQKLGKWYGVNIIVKDTNKFQKYWFTVKSESIADILKSMNGLHSIKYSISDDNVIVSSR